MNIQVGIPTNKQHLYRFHELKYDTLYLCDDIPWAILIAIYDKPGLPGVVNLKATKETWRWNSGASTLHFYEAPKGTTVRIST